LFSEAKNFHAGRFLCSSGTPYRGRSTPASGPGYLGFPLPGPEGLSHFRSDRLSGELSRSHCCHLLFFCNSWSCFV
jgi:hypothetical protein